MIGTSATTNAELTVNLEAGAGSSSSDPAASGGGADDDESTAVVPEVHWYYHLMMAIVSMYFAMLVTNWSIQPVTPAIDHSGAEPDYMHSLSSFWVKISAQWVCLLMYGWTLLAPWLLKDIRDFGVEFD